MNNERDELALAMRQNFSGWMGPSVSYDVADAILAAGYSKHSDELALAAAAHQALESAADAIEEDPYDALDPYYADWLRDRARKIREEA